METAEALRSFTVDFMPVQSPSLFSIASLQRSTDYCGITRVS